MRKVVVGVAIVLTLLIAASGCGGDLGTAFNVVVTKASDSVIEWIGKADVQRAKVAESIDATKAEIKRLQRVEAEASVEVEALSVKLEDLKVNKETASKGLLKLADLIDAGKPVTATNGTVMSVADLRDYAERKKASFETLIKKIAIYDQMLVTLQKTTADAHARWTEGVNTVETLESQLDLLDVQIMALKAVKDQPAINKSSGSYDDIIKETQRLMDETLEKLDKEKATIDKLREIQSSETVQGPQIELDLKSSSDLASELRGLAGK